jgi:hypothetical protein
VFVLPRSFTAAFARGLLKDVDPEELLGPLFTLDPPRFAPVVPWLSALLVLGPGEPPVPLLDIHPAAVPLEPDAPDAPLLPPLEPPPPPLCAIATEMELTMKAAARPSLGTFMRFLHLVRGNRWCRSSSCDGAGTRIELRLPLDERLGEAALLFIFGPSLLAALALEHTNSPAVLRIEHLQFEGRCPPAYSARPDCVRPKTGKDFVLEIAIHCDALSKKTVQQAEK